MTTLVLTGLIGLGLAFLATQNTQGVTLQVGNLIWANIPLYAVALGSLLFGLIISWLISGVNSFFSFIAMHGKNSEIKETNQTVEQLKNRIQELENERIVEHPEAARVNTAEYQESGPKRFFNKLRHDFSL